MNRVFVLIFSCLCTAALPAYSADVGLVGVFPPNAAVLVIDGAEPRSLRVGTRTAGIRLVSVSADRAEIEEGGVLRTVLLGPHVRGSHAAASPRQSVTLSADTRGHFIADAQVNGLPMRFLLDTGATMVAIPGADALRMGLDYRAGRRILLSTANGEVPAYAMKLDSLKVGDITLFAVDAMILEQGLPIGLLGMSFLNRVEMRREAQTMTLTKRY